MRRILIIDPQVGFCELHGSLARSFGMEEVREISCCVTRIEQFLRQHPRPEEILLIRSEYQLGQFTAGDLTHPFAAVCVAGTIDCDWSLSPAARAGKRVITKHVESAASVPALLTELNAGPLEDVLVAGFLTTSCVRKTVLELRRMLPASVKLGVLTDLTASRLSNYVARDGQLSRHDAALAEMAQAQCGTSILSAP